MFAAVLAIPFLSSCGKKDGEATSDATGALDIEWVSEEHWMVSSVVEDLRGMVKLAGGTIANDKVTPGNADHEFEVGPVELPMKPSCWDLESYAPLLASWKPVAGTAAEGAPDLVHDLLTPTAKVLQQSNRTVSSRIRSAPSDPVPHEEAAFLLGVFGIRENARCFGDLRPTLCRMTAHLAVAAHLRGGATPSPAGQWARVLYDLHAGRPIKALELAKAIPAEGDSGRWKRVVEMLITNDWRRDEDLDNPSLAEMIAASRAIRLHRGNQMMLEHAEQHEPLQGIPEWSRSLAGPGRSVEDGHLAMRSVLGMEFLEIAEVFPIGEDPEPAKLAKFLGLDAPARLVAGEDGPKVISDADWAAYFRRHFYTVTSDVSRFTILQWGSMEGAQAWEDAVLPYVKKWPDHDLIEPLIATQAARFQSTLKEAAAFIRRHPEKVPTAAWFDYRFPALDCPPETLMPRQVSWFRQVSPPGTAHDPKQRIRYEGVHGGQWLDTIKALHKIDPWNSELCYELAENTGNNPASVKNAWGAIREYSVRPLKQTLESPSITTEERIETLQTYFAIDPSAGLDLGEILVVAGRPDNAIKAYEGAFENATDRVHVSNTTRWMIHYYKSRGEDAKARAIADHNAEVFSQRGLDSALGLAIVEKDAKRAKKIAKDIHERYGDVLPLAIAGWFAAGDKKALGAVFPDGIKEVTTASFDGSKRVAGLRLSGNGPITRSLGLRAGDRILAIDGKRVDTYPQYIMILSSQLDPKTRIIYQRGQNIVELECHLPDRRLGVGVDADGQ